MLFLVRWIREHLLDSFTRCVRRRRLGTRGHSLGLCLILLLVCIAYQIFVGNLTRNKLLSDYEIFSLNKNDLYPILQKFWENTRESESTVEVESSISSFQTNLSRHVTAASQKKESRLLPGNQQRELNQPSGIKPEATCKPKSHIVFLKTHKTASSTMLNILYRYGESRNLTFALPLNKHSQLSYPSLFKSNFVEGFINESVKGFHIMCNHMRFRKSEVAKVMPEDSFYFSLVREPVSMMESLFIYYKGLAPFQKSPNLEDFINNTSMYYNALMSSSHYAHNTMAFDFGFENDVSADTADLKERASTIIASIEQDFDLILITDYFDESMILLKHALCWSLQEVVYFKLNRRNEQSRVTISPNTVEKIKHWNALDLRIYLHFNVTFWHRVETLIGQEGMKREVAQLRELQAKLLKTCLKEGEAVNPSEIENKKLKPFQYGAAVIQGYNINTDIDIQTIEKCQRIITPELQYTMHLYSKQFLERQEKEKSYSNNAQT